MGSAALNFLFEIVEVVLEIDWNPVDTAAKKFVGDLLVVVDFKNVFMLQTPAYLALDLEFLVFFCRIEQLHASCNLEVLPQAFVDLNVAETVVGNVAEERKIWVEVVRECVRRVLALTSTHLYIRYIWS